MRISIKSALAGTLLSIGMMFGLASSAKAIQITGTLTADNHYGLYFGSSTGNQLGFVGRNEKGPKGNPGKYNWSLPETWNFNINPGDYLYIAVWDDAAVAESWIGEFTIGNQKLLSKAADWEYIFTKGANPGDWGEAPTLAQMQSEISQAKWVGATTVGPNGTSPWGFIPGITNQADFLNVSNPSSQKYSIFRTKVAVVPTPAQPVPEPGTLLGLVGVGVLGLSSMSKRRKS